LKFALSLECGKKEEEETDKKRRKMCVREREIKFGLEKISDSTYLRTCSREREAQ
jgi:hypothetical protein